MVPASRGCSAPASCSVYRVQHACSRTSSSSSAAGSCESGADRGLLRDCLEACSRLAISTTHLTSAILRQAQHMS